MINLRKFTGYNIELTVGDAPTKVEQKTLFNMFGDMMGKLQEAQQKMEEVKDKLDAISVVGEAQV